MQTLLPPERFKHETKHVVNLEPIKVKNSPNEDYITSVVDPAEPHGYPSTLPEEIKEANKTDELCIQICKYFKALSKQKRPTTNLNGCRINNGLLMKSNQIWIPKKNYLHMKTIKKVHD